MENFLYGGEKWLFDLVDIPKKINEALSQMILFFKFFFSVWV